MERYGSVPLAAAGFGLAHLAGIVLLADVLGSSADSTGAFTAHYADDASRFGDIAGAIALLGAALLVVPLGLSLRHDLARSSPALRIDLLAGLALLSSCGLLVAAGLLIAPPLWQSVGDLSGDPGLEPAVAAGLAQAGTAVLVCTLIVVGTWTFLSARLARTAGRIPAWFSVGGWGAAALSLLGITVVATLPLGLWWIGLGLFWRKCFPNQRPSGVPLG